MASTSTGSSSAAPVKVAIIGSGVSGVASAVLLQRRLKETGLTGRVSFDIFEKGPEVGGTWAWNTYPGAACDVPSHWYSFSFALNPYWNFRYSRQNQIQQYIADTAKQFGVAPSVHCNTSLSTAVWDESAGGYMVTLIDSRTGAQRSAFYNFLIAGPGALSEPQLPAIKGRDQFKGSSCHSARWDHGIDMSGKRVAVIGTGCSAAQIVPAIAGKVGSLTVYQRTAPWITPRLDFAYSGLTKFLFAYVPGLLWLYRMTLATLSDIRYHVFIRPISWLNPLAIWVANRHRKTQVPDPVLREALTPDYPMGCKRVVISDEWYPTLQRDNVTLVTGRIEGIDATGVTSSETAKDLAISYRGPRAGKAPAVDPATGAAKVHRDFDVIVYATGFDITGSMESIAVTGRGGLTLPVAFAQRGGPEAYLGINAPGFPNLFFMMGPNTGLGHSSMIAMIECQARYAAQAIATAAKKGWKALEVKEEAHDAYNKQLQSDLKGTVWTGCASWYNMQAKKNVVLWPWTVWAYYKATKNVDWSKYLTA